MFHVPRPRRLMPLVAALLVLAPAAPAQFLPPGFGVPASSVAFAFAADADGWTLSATYEGGPIAACASVVLAEEEPYPAGLLVESTTQEMVLAAAPAGVPAAFEAEGAWSAPLAPGVYFVTAEVIAFEGEVCFAGIPIAIEVFTAGPIEVAAPPPPPMLVEPLRARFWRQHPEAWPVSSLELGGVAYDQAALLDLLRRKPKGDATVVLAKQLVAAKLNLAAGSDPVVAPVVAAADAFLTAVPLGSKPKGPARKEARALARALRLYNRGEPLP